MVTVELQPQLLQEKQIEATIVIILIPIENGLDFLGVLGIMDLSQEVHTLEVVFMILAHATTNWVA